jgi:microcystin-dependent protein
MQVFIGSLMLVPYTRSPTGYAFCQGQLLPLSQNTALFSLLGTYYGGDGKSTFGLPNLVAGLAVGQGQSPGFSNYTIGSSGGSATVTLNGQQVPPHTHQAQGADAVSNSASPTNCALAKPSDGTQIYTSVTSPLVQMQSNSIQPYGNGGPHNNMMPYQVLNWIIALQGIYPSRN